MHIKYIFTTREEIGGLKFVMERSGLYILMQIFSMRKKDYIRRKSSEISSS